MASSPTNLDPAGRDAQRGSRRHAPHRRRHARRVIDESRRLLGLLTARDLRFVETAGTVAERMTPRDRLIVREESLTPRPPKR